MDKHDALRAVLEQYSAVPGSLITVLQKAQDIYGYLPQDVLREIAERMDIPVARVCGVATFYTQFRFTPVGKYFIQLCKVTACHVNGADTIARTIAEGLGISDGETTEDGMFTLDALRCIGACASAPAVTINGKIYAQMSVDKVGGIINDYRNLGGAN